MKKLFEWLKDILYDSIDYIIMIGIIGIVVFIIGWRLDLLFANDALDFPIQNEIVVDNNSNEDIEPTLNDQENGQVIEENNEVEPEDKVVENVPEEVKDPIDKTENNKIIKIVIPAGSLPSKIGSILESNNLVSSRNEFVQKSQELKLDTKLKSGEYNIASGSTIEEILKIITK